MNWLVASMFGLQVSLLFAATTAPAPPRPVAVPNDNRAPAGRWNGSVLEVELVAENATWFPEGEHNAGVEVQVFREEGRPPRVPGPLLRMPVGTELDISVRNAVPDTTLEVHGLQERPADEEQVLSVPFGESRSVRFVAGAPGTYFYWATTGGRPLGLRRDVDSQLSGAFVIDANGPIQEDRVFVLGEWLDPETATALTAERAAYVINGLAWPHTERIHLRMGEPTRWRWVNPSFAGHPMHLHGSFYRILGEGTLLEARQYGPDEQRSVVTEALLSGTTMTTEWTPEHEGNWLMHCHIVAHVSPHTRLAPPHAGTEPHNHALEGMGGMVMGIHVDAAEGAVVVDSTRHTRHLTMYLERKDRHYEDDPGFGVSFREAGAKRTPSVVPGPPLFLTQGQPVNIHLVNDLGEATSVHWHGMELESYYDGVADFGGTVTSVTPSVQPGDTFEVRFTPPRAGTFIYHTHMDDQRQLSAGLYGAMIINEPEAPFDPDVDKVFVIGLLGFTTPETIGINGERQYRTTLTRGVEHRLRIINITANNSGFRVSLVSRSGEVEWRPVAKDGAPLPPMNRKPRLANRQHVAVGETFDFVWTPTVRGRHWLEVRRGGGEWMAQARLDVQ